MTFLCILHLILGLSGFHCEITTVHHVPVKTGGSISIPCLYEQSYRNHAKYLCKGFFPLVCHEVIKTNQTNMVSEKFSISDDTNQTIFTVIINDVRGNDKNFWCAVEIKGQLDASQFFRLQVSEGTPRLYVSEQEITALERGSVTITCHCKDPKITKWCRLGSTCIESRTGLINGTTVKVDTSVPDVFSVTMSGLRTESSGWYWCACNNLQMPVHITVQELATFPTTPTPTTALIYKTTRDVERHTAQSTHSTTAEAGGENLQEQKSSTKVIIIIATLLSQLLIILAAGFGWRIRKHNRTKPEVCDTAMDAEVFDSALLYATIDHNQHAADQTEEPIHTENVTYSTVAVKNNAQQKSAAPEGSVIYSTLKYKKPK